MGGYSLLAVDHSFKIRFSGRVGRLRPGFYYPCYSNKRAQMIEESDWTKTILMSKFNTVSLKIYTLNSHCYYQADLVPLLNYYKDFLIVPQKQVLDCILLEAGLQVSIFFIFGCNDSIFRDFSISILNWTQISVCPEWIFLLIPSSIACPGFL